MCSRYQAVKGQDLAAGRSGWSPAGGRWLVQKGGVQPTASLMHFLMKPFLAAPASFFSAAASQASVASLSHFFMKDVLAAPASFFLAVLTLQVGPSAQGAVALSTSVAAMAERVSWRMVGLSVRLVKGEMSVAEVEFSDNPARLQRSKHAEVPVHSKSAFSLGITGAASDPLRSFTWLNRKSSPQRKLTATSTRFREVQWSEPAQWSCRLCAMTRRKMRSTMLSTAPSRCMK